MNSLRLPDPPTIEPIRRRLELRPALRFKLDPTPEWDDRLIEQIAATGAVDTLDLKGQYPPQAPVAQPGGPRALPARRERVRGRMDRRPRTHTGDRQRVASHRDRITWDFPIRAIPDIEALPFAPRALNIKPARIGRLQTLLDIYDHCARSGIEMDGGVMFELGPGREQLQYLASLFHPDAPNDVAPVEYNRPELSPQAPTSPLTPTPAATGFRPN